MTLSADQLKERILASEPGLAQELLAEDTPFAFVDSPEVWSTARGQLGADLEVEPTQITVVGSASTGFSLAPRKYGTPFHKGSDIDIAVVSSVLYDEMWLSVINWHYRRRHRLPASDRTWDDDRRHDFYWGYLNPVGFQYKGLSRAKPLKPAKRISTRWFSAFQALGLLPELASRKVGGRLYRSAHHLQAYQEHTLRQLRRSFEPSDS